MSRTALVLVVVVAAAALPVAAPAEAAPRKAAQKKGASKPKTCSEAVRGTLVVDSKADELVMAVAFKRETGARRMTLVYNVTGCKLDDKAPEPSDPLPIYPPKTGGAIPDGTIHLARDPSIENGGTRYLVPIKVESSAISPGIYSGLVETRSPVLNPVRTAVTVSRSESRIWVPILWGLLGAVGGFGLFAALRLFKENDLGVNGWLLALAAVISLIVGAIAALTTSYLNQDVWTSSENAWAAVVIGFTASTSGVMTALLAAVWGDEPKPAAGGGGGAADGGAGAAGGGAGPAAGEGPAAGGEGPAAGGEGPAGGGGGGE